jgi:hypothetical protein
MTTFANTETNQTVGGSSKRVSLKSICGTALAVAIIGTASVFAVVQLSQVRFLPNVAKELTQQSAVLSQAGDHDGAVAASRKAVEASRRLMHGSNVHFEPGLAASLHDLAVRLSEAGDSVGARSAIEEAISTRRHLARYSARHVAQLEQSLALLASIETADRGAPANVKTAANGNR